MQCTAHRVMVPQQSPPVTIAQTHLIQREEHAEVFTIETTVGVNIVSRDITAQVGEMIADHRAGAPKVQRATIGEKLE